jgi:hypothetical protein
MASALLHALPRFVCFCQHQQWLQQGISVVVVLRAGALRRFEAREDWPEPGGHLFSDDAGLWSFALQHPSLRSFVLFLKQ